MNDWVKSHLLLVVLSFWGCTTWAETRYGLFVGVNEYDAGQLLTPLDGCVIDATEMRGTCLRNGGWSETNTVQFADSAATLTAVRAAFGNLAKTAKSGDTVLYYQSSHGDSTLDSDGNSTKDACICLYDDDYTDVAFAEDLSAFRDGVRVIVILDACHSGGMFKGAKGAKSVRPAWNFAKLVQARLAERMRGAKGASGPSVGWITAADYDELSWDDWDGAVFTSEFLDGWHSGDADADGDGKLSFFELYDYAKDVAIDDGTEAQCDNEDLLKATIAGVADSAVGASPKAAGNEWFVDAVNGKWEGSGKRADDAFPDLYTALNRAADNDVITLLPGTYLAYNTNEKRHLTIRSAEGSAKTTLTGRYSAWDGVSNATSIPLLTIEGCTVVCDQVYRCTLRNCVIRDATAQCFCLDLQGCVVWNASDFYASETTLRHCTVVDSHFTYWEAGIDTDCLFVGNSRSSGTFLDTVADPRFVDAANGDFRLRAGSAALGAASDGTNLGAWQGAGLAGHVITCFVVGAGDVSVRTIVVDDGKSATVQALEDLRPFGHFEVDGEWATDKATLELSDVRADKTVTAVFDSFEFYVNAATGDDQNDGLSPETAFASIQAALVNPSGWEALDGEVIHVADGVYGPISSYMDRRPVIVSDNGPEKTIIDGEGVESCANLFTADKATNVVLRGFTLRNGSSSCGGGAYYGLLEDCILVNNWAECGGGAAWSTLRHCVVYGNEATEYGPAIYSSTAYDSILWNNQGAPENKTYRPTLYRCCTDLSDANVSRNDGTFDADPLLLSPEHGIFRLRKGSPCLGAAADGGNVGWYQGPGVEGYVVQFDPGLHGAFAEGAETVQLVVAGEDATAPDVLPDFGWEHAGWSVSLKGVSGNCSPTALYRSLATIDNTNAVERTPFEAHLGLPCATGALTWKKSPSSDLPGGLTLSADGTLSGEIEMAGTYDFEVRAEEAGGRWAAVPVSVTVAEHENKRPAIAAVSPADAEQALSIGASATFAVSASDANGDALTYVWSLDGSPLEGETSSSLSLSVTEALRGNHRLTCDVSDGFWTVRAADWRLAVLINFAVDAANGSDENDGRSPESCKRTIQSAVDAAVDGDVIRVSPGVYEPFETRDLRITIIGLGGAEKCIVDGGHTNRCAHFGWTTNTVVQGFTLRNGFADDSGGGAYYGTLIDCALIGNKAGSYGGGAAYSTLSNCTVVGNEAEGQGGVCGCELYRSIVWGNVTRLDDGSYKRSSSASESCIDFDEPYVYGSGLIWDDPLFVSVTYGDLRLRTGSRCLKTGMGFYRGAGVDGFVIETRVLGSGAAEPPYAVVAAGETVTFTPVSGERAFLGFSTDGETVVPGTEYAWTAEEDGTLYLHYLADLYVDAGRSDDTGDGLTWKTAKRTIQSAIDIALPGDTIHVADGTYGPIVADNLPIVLVGENGAENCVIDGGGTNRCAILASDPESGRTDTVVRGMTLRNGGFVGNGGGVCGGTLEDCVVENCSTHEPDYFYDYGGGTYYTTLRRCVVRNNRSTYGGGVAYGEAYDCLLVGNVGTSSGGGAYRAQAYGCTIVSNQAEYSGGGTYYGSCCNSIVWGNSASGSDSASNYYSTTFKNSCTLPAADSWYDNIDEDPCFVDPDDGDWRLWSHSPCIDAGDLSYVKTETDLAGTNRVIGASVDMGAYEGGVDVPLPGAVGDVRATDATGAGFVRVEWSRVPYAKKYRVYRSEGTDPAGAAVVGETTGCSYDDGTAVPGKAYNYWVAAVNPAGASDITSSGSGHDGGSALDPLVITSTALPTGTTAVAYSTRLSATGGKAPYVWSSSGRGYALSRADSTWSTDVGELVGVVGDDTCLSYTLPFAFTFYGKTYDRVWVGSNGTVMFDGSYNEYSPSRDKLAARTMIAAFWRDLIQGGGGVYAAVGTDSVTFTWRNNRYHASDSLVNASVTLTKAGTIRMAFGGGNAIGALVGVSAGDGERVECYDWTDRSLANVQDCVFTPNGMPDGLELDAETGVVSGMSTTLGDFVVRLTVRDACGNVTTTNAAISVVRYARTVTAEAEPAVVAEGGTVVITPRVGQALAEDSYAFLVPADEVSSNAVACTAFERGLRIPAGACVGETVEMTALDGSAETRRLAYTVELRTAAERGSGAHVDGYLDSTMNLSVTNVAPAIVSPDPFDGVTAAWLETPIVTAWSVSDVRADETNGLRVIFSANPGTFVAFANCTSGVATNFVTGFGEQTVTMTVTDKDGGRAERTWRYSVDRAAYKAVTFNAGEHGMVDGGKSTVRYARTGGAATAPQVRADSAWAFDCWSGDFSCVSNDCTVTATYRSAYPDLYVETVTNAASALAGGTTTVGWTVGNTGYPDFSGKMTERITLTSVADTNDVRTVAEVEFSGRIARDGTVDRVHELAIPLKGLEGDWLVGVETAVKPSVREAGGDNRGVSGIRLHIDAVPLPDLMATNVVSATELRPGDTVTVSYATANVGLAPAGAPWTETVWLETVAEAPTRVRVSTQTVTNGLGVGESRSTILQYAIPELVAISGDVRFVVTVDSEDEVVEADDAVNNTAVSAAATLSKRLYLTSSAASVKENDAAGVRFTAKRSGATGEPLEILVRSSGATDDVTCPAAVTIPAGGASTIFRVVPVDNEKVDGRRKVTLALAADGFESANFVLTVEDDEVPSLTVALDKTSVREGDGAITATVTRELVTDEPLTVYLSDVSTSRCDYPASVVIAAGEASATFSIAPVNNDVAQVSAELGIRASAVGYTAARASFTVEDDDIPGVTLKLTPEEVAEGDRVYATLTRSDTNRVEEPVTVVLTASEKGQVTFPGTVTIPSYTMAVRFQIFANDNGDDEGDREVGIDGAIRIPSCGCNGQPSNGDVISATLVIRDNDGPTLSVRPDVATMKEGREVAGWLTVSHNSTLTSDLTVALSHDGAGEIELPETVTISAGETSVRVPVRTLDDGVEDGSKLVSVYVDDPAGTFGSGSAFVQVSDQNLPDLTAPDIRPSAASVVALREFGATFSVSNVGFAGRSGTVPYEVHLVRGAYSRDTSDSTRVAEGVIEGPFEVGGVSAPVQVALAAPELPGDYRLAVVLDPDETFAELDKANNTTWSEVFGVTVAYTANVAPVKAVFAPGETVALTGNVVNAEDGGPAAGARVEVYVISDGVRRTVEAASGDDGSFSAEFVPAENEGGHYSVGASYPGIGSTAEQATFDIPALRLKTSGYLTWDVLVGDVSERTFTVYNPSRIPLTGLSVSGVSVPAGCEVSFDGPEEIAGGASAVYTVTARATDTTPGVQYLYFSFELTSSEGPSVTVPAAFYAQSLQALVRAAPPTRRSTVTVGRATYFTYELTNTGMGDSGPIALTLPGADWIRSVGGNTISSLRRGESATVTIEVIPPLTLVLNKAYDAEIGVACETGNAITLGLSMVPVSEETGSLRVDVTDTLTMTAEGAPHVSNATVRVTNPGTGVVVAEGATGADGVFEAFDIPAGSYQLVVEAAKHGSECREIRIEPGAACRQAVYLEYQSVTYTWRVVRTEIEDEYRIDLLLDFETQVPAPTLVIHVPESIPELQAGESHVCQVVLENTGLIKMVDIRLSVDGSIGDLVYEQITPKVNEIPALSSVPVYVRFTKPAATKAAKGATAGEALQKLAPCTFGMMCLAKVLCGDEGVDMLFKSKNIMILGTICNVVANILNNLPNPGAWGGDAPSRGGGGGGAVVGSMREPIESVSELDCACMFELLDQMAGHALTNWKIPVWVWGVYQQMCKKRPTGKAERDDVKAAWNAIKGVGGAVNKNIANLVKARKLLNNQLKAFEKCAQVVGREKLESRMREVVGDIDRLYRLRNMLDEMEQFYGACEAYGMDDTSAKSGRRAKGDVTEADVLAAADRLIAAALALEDDLAADGLTDPESWFRAQAEMFEKYTMGGEALSMCATVTLKLSQRVTMTREAFEGTLTLNNGEFGGDLTSVRYEPIIKNADGRICNDLFGVTDRGHSGAFSGTSFMGGDLSLPSGQTGEAVILFVPTVQAAEKVPTVYYFGGRLSYYDEVLGKTVTNELIPVPLTVNPCPYLTFDYFVQRDVYADDPFTKDVNEASLPAEFSVLIRNEGYGDAQNVRIQSAQPEMVENEKGLCAKFELKDYSLDAMALNGATAHLGLHDVNLGTIAAQSTVVAQWWLTSTIEGHFTGASATVTHLNSWGNPDTSLIGDVRVHRLVRSVVADDDALPDFLTTIDMYGTPNELYTSGGDVVAVRSDARTDVSGALSGANPEIAVTVASVGPGWTYATAVRGGLSRYRIVGIVREDGTELDVRNAWITDRTFRDAARPLLEDRLHLTDWIGESGDHRYVIRLEAKPSDVVAVDSFESIEDGALEYSVRDSVTVVFTKAIDATTFTVEDLTFIRQGEFIDDLTMLSISPEDESGTRFAIGNLGELCGEFGHFQLTVQCAGIADVSGQLGTAGRSVGWNYTGGDVPSILGTSEIPLGAVRAFDAFDISFTMPVKPETFTAATVSVDGRPAGGAVSVTAIDGSGMRFRISGFGALVKADGKHTLSVDARSVQGENGIFSASVREIEWTIDTTPPAINWFREERNAVVRRFEVAFDEAIDSEGVGLSRFSLTRGGQPVGFPARAALFVDGGRVVLQGIDDDQLEDGDYALTFNATGVRDRAGNEAEGSRTYSWTVDRTPPEAPTDLAISPDGGESATDGRTCVRELTVSGKVAEPNLTVTILLKGVSGSETVLERRKVEGLDFSIPVTLPGDGNMTLVVRVEDAKGNQAEAEMAIYVDALALTAELSGAPTLYKTAENGIAVTFSEKVVAEEVTADLFALYLNGAQVALTNASVRVLGETGFRLEGIGEQTAEEGIYRLEFAGSRVHKSSTGLAGSDVSLEWQHIPPDVTPPWVTFVALDGAAPAEAYTNGFSEVRVGFSEEINLAALKRNGLVSQALKIVSSNRTVNAVSGAVTWDAATTALVWNVGYQVVPHGALRIVVDAGLVTDTWGNRLLADGFAPFGGLSTFVPETNAVVKVDSYAMPTWYDFDGDGLGDLIVGEKTTAGTGKVRIYLNAGTAEAPAFASFAYLTANGQDVELGANGCQGAQAVLADLTGDGVDDAIVGSANGAIRLYPGNGDGTFGDGTVIRDGAEPTFGSERAVMCVTSVGGTNRLVVGGLDGKFRTLTYNAESNTINEAWLETKSGRVLTVASGRSSPALADVNGDGIADLVSGDTDGGLTLFFGEGESFNGTAYCVYSNDVGIAETLRTRPCFADVNGDGIADLLVGRADGSVEMRIGHPAESPSVAVLNTTTFTVMFDANGGEGEMEPMDFTYDVDQELVSNVFARTGYAYAGWATSPTGEVAYADGAVVSNLTEEADGEVTLYAVWTANPYQVVFDKNDALATGEMDAQGFVYDEPSNLASNGFAKVGYTFAGWATNATGAAVYADGAEVVNLAAESGATVTLFATWTPNRYTVAFDGNGVTSGEMADQAFTYDESQALTGNAFAKVGYTFAGWAFGEGADSAVLADGEVVSNLTAVADGVVTLFATWTPNSYTVAFDANGATSGVTEPMGFTYDVAQALTANGFAKVGYTFAGWAFGGDVIADGATVSNLTAEAGGTVTLLATWTPNEYTIGFHGGEGGAGSMDGQPMTYDEEEALYSNLFFRVGYTFVGWTDDEEELESVDYLDGAVVSNLTAEVDGEFDLWAVWTPNEYQVLFDANGGDAGEMDPQDFVYDVEQALASNAYSKVGYTFAGWANCPTGEVAIADGAVVSNLTAEADGTVTLYAVWAANPYQVSFDGNDELATGEMDAQDLVYDAADNLASNGFAKVGYTFAGWATNATGEAVYADGAEVVNLAAESGATVTLFATWTPNRYTVAFDGNGATSGEMADQAFTYDESQALTGNAFAKVGYTFAGWAFGEGADSAVLADGEVVSNLTAVADGVVTLFATWTPNSYTVAFDGNGATSGAMEPMDFTYDAEQALTQNGFAKVGYTFAGWAFGEDVIADGATVSNLTAEAGGTVTLFAAWTPNEYTVGFHGGEGGEGSMPGEPMTYDDEEALYSNLFFRVGYTFVGWTDDEMDLESVDYLDGAVVSNLTAEVDGEFDLWAVWTPNAYTVKFEANGGKGTMADQEFLYDEGQALSSNAFVRTGYTFAGWADCSTGEVAYADGAVVSNLTAEADGVVTLHAMWSVTPGYTILGCERVEVDEGGVLSIPVIGGHESLASSVQVLITYNTASAADLDLKGATVNDVKPKNFKFPVTLEWAAGEIGEKTVEIPVVVDKAVEADETLTLELANPMNMEIIENSACRVTIRDPQFVALKSAVESGTATKAQSNDLQKIEKALVGKAYVRGMANDATRGKVTGSARAAIGKTVTLKATANKGWVFAGWLGEESDEVLSRETSYAVSVTGDADYTARFIAPEEDSLSLGADFLPAEFVTGEAVSIEMPVESVSLPTVTVSGLPAGLKYYAKKTDVKATATASAYTIPANTIYGTVTAKAATKPETVTVTVKNLGGYQITRKYEVSVVAAKSGTGFAKVASDAPAYHSVALSHDDDFNGSVTGAGVYQAGKKVTLKATANKGYVFNGWYEGEALVSQAASYAFTMPDADVAYEARFITTAKDKASIAASVNGMDLSGASGETPLPQCATNVMAGVYLEWPVAASAQSQPTVAVSGLPSGLKFTAKPITSKVGTGKTAATVTNVAANTIYGTPTAASKTDKKGNVTPSKVQVTVTTAGKSTAVYEIALTVDPLPAWAAGEFGGLALTKIRKDGVVTETRWGSASLTIGSAGKISGKVIVNGTNCTFTAASYDSFKKGKSDDDWQATAICSLKIGKQVVPMELAVVSGGAFVDEDDLTVDLFRNSWKDKGAKPAPEEYQGTYSVKLASDKFRTGYLLLTVDKKGAVKVSGKAPDGTSLSATATLVPAVDPEGAAYYFADVFAAPSAYKGGYLAGTVNFLADRTLSGYVEWRSYNPQSTGDYEKGGFDRALDCSGAKYDKTASLKDGFDTLRLSAFGVGEDLFITVDQTGKKFVVVDKGDAKLTFSFTQSTGIWKGTYLMWPDPSSTRSVKVSFEGILVSGEKDLQGFGTYDATSSYPVYNKKGEQTGEKSYKYKESVPVRFNQE